MKTPILIAATLLLMPLCAGAAADPNNAVARPYCYADLTAPEWLFYTSPAALETIPTLNREELLKLRQEYSIIVLGTTSTLTHNTHEPTDKLYRIALVGYNKIIQACDKKLAEPDTHKTKGKA